jgi:apolipoprotein N-acyltransferase
VPLPTPGVSLRLRDGRRVPLGTGVPNPTALVTLLEGGGATVRRHAGFLHAATIRERGVAYAILKYAVFGAAPAAILFYTHQHIAYGGTFGQWYLEGPSAWLSTLAQYWATTVILLVSYASFWRIGAELVVWITGALRAEWAPTARWIVEVACALAYFGGVPLLLALRYLA